MQEILRNYLRLAKKGTTDAALSTTESADNETVSQDEGMQESSESSPDILADENQEVATNSFHAEAVSAYLCNTEQNMLKQVLDSLSKNYLPQVKYAIKKQEFKYYLTNLWLVLMIQLI